MIFCVNHVFITTILKCSIMDIITLAYKDKFTVTNIVILGIQLAGRYSVIRNNHT